jgi:hypothetical protein
LEVVRVQVQCNTLEQEKIAQALERKRGGIGGEKILAMVV